MDNNLNSVLGSLTTRSEKHLDKIMSLQNHAPTKLYEAMSYSCLNGGNRVRPLLAYLTGQWLNLPLNKIDNLASAIEIIHCYSLVHDDLPAMDNDDLRRGKPSCHIAFSEGIAILVGDALQSLAFELLVSSGNIEPSHQSKLVSILSKACGANGMAGGQVLDIESTNKTISLSDLQAIHELKTQTLLSCAISMVCVLSPHNNIEKINAIESYGKHIGLAFQIQDDILDVEGTTSSLGKPAQSDINNNKNTYCHLLGIDNAKKEVDILHQKALQAISKWPEDNNHLIGFANFLLHRKS